MLGDELFRRRHRMGAEIVMPDAGNAHEALGRLDQAIQPLAECNRNDSVVLAVHHQHWRRKACSRANPNGGIGPCTASLIRATVWSVSAFEITEIDIGRTKCR